jgi:hypothetical protein
MHMKNPVTPRPPQTHKGTPVPYIAAWSAEQATDIARGVLMVRANPFTGRQQLRYRDEHPLDRDRHGIVWHRVAWAPGQGRPLFAEIHTLRQRRAMSRVLCQVCAGPGEVWMTPALLWNDHLAEHGSAVPYATNDPPVCRRCALLAATHCPEIDSRTFTKTEAFSTPNLRPRRTLATSGGRSSRTWCRKPACLVPKQRMFAILIQRQAAGLVGGHLL